jgi:hypothetical protein
VLQLGRSGSIFGSKSATGSLCSTRLKTGNRAPTARAVAGYFLSFEAPWSINSPLAGGDEPTHEFRGSALHRRQWESVQKPVQTEDDEDEAQEGARNYDGFGSHD